MSPLFQIDNGSMPLNKAGKVSTFRIIHCPFINRNTNCTETQLPGLLPGPIHAVTSICMPKKSLPFDAVSAFSWSSCCRKNTRPYRSSEVPCICTEVTFPNFLNSWKRPSLRLVSKSPNKNKLLAFLL